MSVELVDPPHMESDMIKALRNVNWKKILLFYVSLVLFILAIYLMKEGAHSLVPFVRDQLQVSNAFNGLGFGWLSAYLIMSGSPIAAATLTFLDAGAISTTTAFAMIIGSRFGASFIVLFIGFIYVLRGRNRATSLSMGLLSLTVTQITFLAGMLIGLPMLKNGWFSNLRFDTNFTVISIIDGIYEPIVVLIDGLLPTWLVFLLGLGIILFSFNLFDKSLPQMTLKQSQMGRLARLIFRPWVMFLLGGFITMISMSVSISLGLLVPLSQRGYIRRENVIPYIMGANITTFVDTLFAALILNNPDAFTIVLIGMLTIAIVSIVLLLTVYEQFNRFLLSFVDTVTENNQKLMIYMLTIFIIPIVLMFI